MAEPVEQLDAAQPRRFLRYPEYRELGIESIESVPTHWDVRRLKFLAKLSPSGAPARAFPPKTDVSFLPMEAIGEWGGLELSSVKSLAEVATGYTYFADGDVIVAKITPCFENGKGAIAERLENGVAFGTTELHVLRAGPSVHAKYLFYVTVSHAFRHLGAAQMYGAGGQKRVPEAFIRDFRQGIPDLREQRAIATFLDRETAKIDALLEKKKRLIELLQEQRAALITRAVTRGLDPDVPMKDSGVEWLGEIPAHWLVRPLKLLSDLQTGLTLGKGYEGEETVTRPYLRVANVQDGFLSLDDIATVDLPIRDAKRFELRTGDVLLTEGGDFDKLGRGYVWEGQLPDCLHQNHIFSVRPTPGVLLSQFLAAAIGSGYGRAYFTATSKQSTNLASTNSTKLGNFPIPLPPPDEQTAIMASVARQMARIDSLIAKVKTANERLDEFRTALIAAAVAGKVDVRTEVP